MKRQVGWVLGAMLMVLALSARGLSQGSSPAYPNAVPVTVQIVVTKGEGEKKISTPYSLTSTSGEVTSLRLGAEVPVSTAGTGLPTSFTFQQIGTQIDFRIVPVESGAGARPSADGRYKVQMTITRRDVYDRDSAPPVPQRDPSRPMFYNFTFAGTLVLGNGETAQITGSDLITGEPWRADVTLSLKK